MVSKVGALVTAAGTVESEVLFKTYGVAVKDKLLAYGETDTWVLDFSDLKTGVPTGVSPKALGLPNPGPVIKSVLHSKLTKALGNLTLGIGVVPLSYSVAIHPTGGTPMSISKAAKEKKISGILALEKETGSPGTGVVPLVAATNLLQPVSGTDPGSVYYVVAMAKGFAIAVRRKKVEGGVRVSLRANGTSIGSYTTALELCGYKISGNGHLSCHLETGSHDEALRVVGAMVYGTGIVFSQLLLDLGKLPYDK